MIEFCLHGTEHVFEDYMNKRKLGRIIMKNTEGWAYLPCHYVIVLQVQCRWSVCNQWSKYYNNEEFILWGNLILRNGVWPYELQYFYFGGVKKVDKVDFALIWKVLYFNPQAGSLILRGLRQGDVITLFLFLPTRSI